MMENEHSGHFTGIIRDDCVDSVKIDSFVLVKVSNLRECMSNLVFSSPINDYISVSCPKCPLSKPRRRKNLFVRDGLLLLSSDLNRFLKCM